VATREYFTVRKKGKKRGDWGEASSKTEEVALRSKKKQSIGSAWRFVYKGERGD